MYKFSDKSKAKLDTCHEDIQAIMNEVIKVYDFTVLEGQRTKDKQQEYYKKGLSKLDGINKKSKHQATPKSMAIDIMPYKSGTNAFSGKESDTRRFIFLAGIVYTVAESLYMSGKITHKIRWGGDWNSNHIFSDQSFNDLPHFELKKV